MAKLEYSVIFKLFAFGRGAVPHFGSKTELASGAQKQLLLRHFAHQDMAKIKVSVGGFHAKRRAHPFSSQRGLDRPSVGVKPNGLAVLPLLRGHKF